MSNNALNFNTCVINDDHTSCFNYYRSLKESILNDVKYNNKINNGVYRNFYKLNNVIFLTHEINKAINKKIISYNDLTNFSILKSKLALKDLIDFFNLQYLVSKTILDTYMTDVTKTINIDVNPLYVMWSYNKTENEINNILETLITLNTDKVCVYTISEFYDRILNNSKELFVDYSAGVTDTWYDKLDHENEDRHINDRTNDVVLLNTFLIFNDDNRLYYLKEINLVLHDQNKLHYLTALDEITDNDIGSIDNFSYIIDLIKEITKALYRNKLTEFSIYTQRYLEYKLMTKNYL